LQCRDELGPRPTAGLTAAYTRYMDRTTLLSMVTSAASLNQISSVTVALRQWLIEHPEDAEMRDALQGLLRTERAFLGAGSIRRT
jgi:hypothetical protein